MNTTKTIMISLLFVLGGLGSIVPTASAQEAEVVVTDDPGDVVLYPGGTNKNAQPTPVDAAPIPVDQVTGPADLTGFKVHGETATDLSFEMTVADFSRVNTWQPANIFLSLCFTWSATGAMYRFFYTFGFTNPTTPEVTSKPRFDGGSFERVDACVPYEGDNTAGRIPGSHTQVYPHNVDLDEGKITWTIPRKVFEVMNPTFATDETLDPRPMAGDTLSGLQAYAVSRGGPSFITYDTTSTDDFTFQMDTGNDKVKVIIPKNSNVGRGIGSFDTPLFGVEIGSYQIVPVTIENYLDTPIEPNITAQVLSGEESKWEIRTLPSIPVPKANGDKPGTTTVTLIVNSDSSVTHKDLVRVLISAMDKTQPHLGAQAVDIVGVAPPQSGSSTLYFHSSGNPCQMTNRWVNTLQADTSSTAADIPFHSCDPQNTGAGSSFTEEVSYVFGPDVPFARDYVLSTTERAQASLFLRSVIRQNHPTQTEVPASMVADVKVEVLAGSEVIGEGILESQTIAGERTPLKIPVEIFGEILGGSGRQVDNDKGINIRVSVVAVARTFEIGGCVQGECTPQDEEEFKPPGGKIYMDMGDSNIVLPILKSERAGESYNITKSGALITLRLAEQGAPKQVFTNPGKVVVFNLTVRNEGVNVDTARISGVVDDDWKVEILPAKEYKLTVGQPRSFNVRVTAPATAGEGDTLRLDIIATSKVDPEAKARLPLFVEVTTGQQFDDQEVDPDLQDLGETEGSPAPPVVVLLGVLALLGVALRRRR